MKTDMKTPLKMGLKTGIQNSLQKTLSLDEEKVKHIKEETQTQWHHLSEAAVPTGTFGEGEEGMRTLRVARGCLFVLYAVLGLILLCSMVTIILGRQEVVDHRMKFAHLESPSIAVCPWLPGTTIQKIPDASYSIHAVKYTLSGKRYLANKTHPCIFDRVCECLDLRAYTLDDVDDSYHGPTGESSMELQRFRERIDVETNLMDPSPARTLKFGLYDSIDPRPSWVYGAQWATLFGQLKLDQWMVSEAGWANLKAVITGDMSKLDRRHFYTYTFSATKGVWSVDQDHHRYTAISYEFKTFFVLETITASSSWSVFTLFSLVILAVAFSNILLIWEQTFPIYIEESGELQKRRVAWPLRWLSQKCNCGDLAHGHDEPRVEPSYGSV